jgi:hypothetical protein
MIFHEDLTLGALCIFYSVGVFGGMIPMSLIFYLPTDIRTIEPGYLCKAFFAAATPLYAYHMYIHEGVLPVKCINFSHPTQMFDVNTTRSPPFNSMRNPNGWTLVQRMPMATHLRLSKLSQGQYAMAGSVVLYELLILSVIDL